MIERSTDTALILVDVQNDFCPGGSLAVSEGDKVVKPLNQLIDLARQKNWLIVAGRDWHPADTVHFIKDGGIWPVHCVAETEGAKFHQNLDTIGAVIISKGMDPENPDSYSEFQGVTKNGKTLEQLLREFGVTRVLVGGLATDYCVKATAIDAVKLGFDTYLQVDAAKAVNLAPEDEGKAIQEMFEAGVKEITSVLETAKILG